MLKELSAQAVAEGKNEEVSFAKFQHWCSSSTKALKKAISAENEKIEILEATVSAKKKEIATFEEEIAALEEEIAKKEAAMEKLDKEREEGKALYEKTSADLEVTISAVEEAIKIISESRGTNLLQLTPQVRRTLEMAEMLAPPGARADLAALLQAPVMVSGDAAAHVKKYKFKSGNIIELLKQLKAKFEDDLLETNKAETNAENAYALAKDALEKAKAGALADAKAALAEAEATLADVTADLEADTATLGETEKSCAIKTSEWGERSETRAKEIEAIAAAIKILAEVGGVRTEAPENPVPPPSPVADLQLALSFLQVRGAVADPKMKAVNFLRAQAKVLHSHSLERLAQQVAVHLGGPFDEVKGMIEKMIFRLMAEQKDEDAHKHWCDLELEKTNTSKVDKEEKIAELTVKIDEASAKIQALAEEIKEAQQMIADIDSHVKEATEIRKVGKEENALAIKDSEAAQTAIANAVAVLEEFYKSSGMVAKQPYEFLQQGGKAPVELPESPATWESSYTGVADPMEQPSGIISVLQTIAADFAKMEAQTRAQEESDQKAYEEDMSKCAIEKARRMKEVEMKTQESRRLSDKVDALTKTKKHVADELAAVVQYLKDLEPACVTGDSTYEDRKAARAKEIEALREAQNILEDAFKAAPSAPAPATASFLQRK